MDRIILIAIWMISLSFNGVMIISMRGDYEPTLVMSLISISIPVFLTALVRHSENNSRSIN